MATGLPKPQAQGIGGQAGAQPLGPFDEQGRISFEQAERIGFGRVVKPVEITVPHRHGQILIGLHQRVGGGGHVARPAQGVQDQPRQGGFAGTEIALQRDDVAGAQHGGKRGSHARGFSFAGQRQHGQKSMVR